MISRKNFFSCKTFPLSSVAIKSNKVEAESRQKHSQKSGKIFLTTVRRKSGVRNS